MRMGSPSGYSANILSRTQNLSSFTHRNATSVNGIITLNSDDDNSLTALTRRVARGVVHSGRRWRYVVPVDVCVCVCVSVFVWQKRSTLGGFGNAAAWLDCCCNKRFGHRYLTFAWARTNNILLRLCYTDEFEFEWYLFCTRLGTRTVYWFSNGIMFYRNESMMIDIFCVHRCSPDYFRTEDLSSELLSYGNNVCDIACAIFLYLLSGIKVIKLLYFKYEIRFFFDERCDIQILFAFQLHYFCLKRDNTALKLYSSVLHAEPLLHWKHNFPITYILSGHVTPSSE